MRSATRNIAPNASQKPRRAIGKILKQSARRTKRIAPDMERTSMRGGGFAMLPIQRIARNAANRCARRPIMPAPASALRHGGARIPVQMRPMDATGGNARSYAYGDFDDHRNPARQRHALSPVRAAVELVLQRVEIVGGYAVIPRAAIEAMRAAL